MAELNARVDTINSDSPGHENGKMSSQMEFVKTDCFY